MQFKFLFILFNSIILFFLVLVLIIPFALFGPEFAGIFWRSGWPLAVILLLLLAGITGYYCTNRRLFALLEKEDWPALVQYLEGRVLQEQRYTPHLVRLLANSYLVLSDSIAVMALERKLAIAKPSLVEANALTFGIARILGKDNAGAVRFFSQRLALSGASANAGLRLSVGSGGRSRGWILWYYGFSLLLDRQFAAAAEQFSFLARESRDGMISGMSAFFLGTTLLKALPDKAKTLQAAAEDGRVRVRRVFPSPQAWRKETEKQRTEVYVVVLFKYIGSAADWIYKETV